MPCWITINKFWIASDMSCIGMCLTPQIVCRIWFGLLLNMFSNTTTQMMPGVVQRCTYMNYENGYLIHYNQSISQQLLTEIQQTANIHMNVTHLEDRWQGLVRSIPSASALISSVSPTRSSPIFSVASLSALGRTLRSGSSRLQMRPCSCPWCRCRTCFFWLSRRRWPICVFGMIGKSFREL